MPPARSRACGRSTTTTGPWGMSTTGSALRRPADHLFRQHPGASYPRTGPKGCMLVTRRRPARLRCSFSRWTCSAGNTCRVDASGATSKEDLLDRVRRRLAELMRPQPKPLAGRAGRDRRAVRGPSGNRCRAQQLDQRDPAAGPGRGRGPLWIEKVAVAHTLPATTRRPIVRWPHRRAGTRSQNCKADPEAVLRQLAGEFADLLKKLRRS